MSAIAVATIASPGCMTAPRGLALVQETAHEMNIHTRFGRIEAAIEHVSPKVREEFLNHRQGWGGKILIADAELSSVRLTAERQAEVAVRVGWYRVEEGELRVTTLRQQWHDYSGTWRLEGEQRADGDVGLLGETVVVKSANDNQAPKQFPTVQLRGGTIH